MFLNFKQSSAVVVFCLLSAACSANIFGQNRQPKPGVTLAPSPEISEPTIRPLAAVKDFDNNRPGKGLLAGKKIDSPESLNSGRQEVIDERRYTFYTEWSKARNEAARFTMRKPFEPLPAGLNKDLKNPAPPDDAAQAKTPDGFQWRPAVGQAMAFLAIQHGYALTQPKTRQALKGKFWKDYGDSVKSLRGWDDGGRFFTNYIAHPMQGAFTGFIYVQNHPKESKLQFENSGRYWRSRAKALAWSAAWSTQFEIGPVSQASIGNVGLKGKQTWGDIIVTPTVGTAMLITEDAIDRFIMRPIERNFSSFYLCIFSRMLLSPTRTIANVFRFKKPWHRDRPMGQ